MNVNEVIAAAKQQCGLSDFGDPAILEGLEVLLKSFAEEAQFSERGAQIAHAGLVSTLANRMRVEDWLKRNPQALDAPIEKPLFVFGLPRTGTTLTINLLAADPMRRSFLRWEAFDSVPPPGSEELHAGPRYEKSQAQIDFSMKYMPHISAIHHENGDSPTECQFSMSPSFCAQVYDSQHHVPSYHDWFLNKADYRPAFRYHKRLLQLLQSSAPGRWTLKNPWHPLFLNELAEIYPDAQLVMTHRDPVEVVGSACSLLKAVRPIYTDHVDLAAIGAMLMETFDVMIARQDAFRAKHGDGAIFDIQYADQLRDPIGVMKRLYAHFDEPLTRQAEQAMTAMLAQNPKGKHGKHEYSLEEYGLSAAGVRAHFADYVERFGITVRG